MSSFAWSLSRPKFFDKFKIDDPNATKGSKTQSLAFVLDGVYYYWKSSTNTLIKANCSDIWDLDGNGTNASYEEWSLSQSIAFSVENLSVQKNPTEGEACLLWGPTGAAVVTFTSREKSRRVATCELLGELTYIENSRLRIIQAKWHPTTAYQIIMILNNDNFIRSYNIEDPRVIISATSVGTMDSIPLRYNAYLSSIDFDFGPHLALSDQWTIFLLKSNGTISYLLMKFIANTDRHAWEPEKPVPIDGEGEDADVFKQPGSLSVSGTYPLLITVGSLSGSLHHGMLLPNVPNVNETSPALDDAFVTGEVVLYVKESIMIEEPTVELCNFRLLPDPLCSYRYARVHQEGIHLITVNFVHHIKKLLTSDGILDPYADTSAACTYLLCCKQDKGKQTDLVTATFSDTLPQKFVAVTATGETLVYDIPKFIGLETGFGGETDKSRSQLNPIAINAVENVISRLAKTSNQPYISFPPDLSPEKKEELIRDSFEILENEYIEKHIKTLRFLRNAVKNLYERLEDTREGMTKLKTVQPTIRDKAEELAEQYEELNEVQAKLLTRYQAVLSHYERGLPVMSDEEKKWAKKFKEYASALPHIRDQVDGLLGTVQRRLASMKLTDASEGWESPPRVKISAMELLEMKREVIQHQKMLGELTQSIQEVSENIY